MKEKINFYAMLTFLNEEESKKSTPFLNGFRAKLKFSFSKITYIGILNFIDLELVYPNDYIKTKITILTDDLNINNLYSGLDFDFFEFEQIIGSGVILEVIS